MTERKRANGFCLMDAAFAADAKFVRLARRAADPPSFAAAVGVFWLILADCRRAKSPEVEWEDYSEYASQITALKDARLLTPSGFDPDTFERWAPAYRAPKERTGTDGYEEVRKVPSSTIPSGQVSSGHISSQNTEGGAGGGLPGEDDAVTAACRMLMNGGEWLGNREYVHAFDDMEHRYSPEWVTEELQPAYAAVLEQRGKVLPWDLKRMIELRCAERSRREERARAQARLEWERQETERLQQREATASPAEREQARLQREAIRIAMTRRLTVPTDPREVRKFVMKYGEADQAGGAA